MRINGHRTKVQRRRSRKIEMSGGKKGEKEREGMCVIGEKERCKE